MLAQVYVGSFKRKKGIPKQVPFWNLFYVDFGGHFGGPKPIKNNIKSNEKLDHFWEPSGEAPGAVFCGFLAPQSEGLGGQKWVQNRVDNKTRDFQILKENPMVFQYFIVFLGSLFQ